MNTSDFLEFCRGAAIIGGSVGGLWGLYRASRGVYDDLSTRYFLWKDRELNLAGKKRRLVESFIEHDENGLLPVVYDRERGVMLNANVSAVWDVVSAQVNQAINEKLAPIREKVYLHQKLLAASGKGSASKTQNAVLDASVPELPTMIHIDEIFKDLRPSINNIVLGKTQDGIVSRSLENLLHVLAVGESGSGKSSFLQNILYQFALAKEPLSVVCVDHTGTGFAVLAGWDKLRYPLSDNDSTTLAILQEIKTELDRRRVLYSEAKTVKNLSEYNRLGGEQLTPIVIMIDESIELLDKKTDIGRLLGDILRIGRQFGVYVFVSGKHCTADILPVKDRTNFRSRVCFGAEKSISQVVLGDRCAEDITLEGRCYTRLRRQRGIVEMQVPYVTLEQLEQVLVTGEPANTMPAPAQPEQPTGQDVVEIWGKLPDKEQNVSGVCRVLYQGKSTAGANWQKTKALLQDAGLVE